MSLPSLNKVIIIIIIIIITTASLMPAPYIPDIRLETAEDTCMTLDS